MQMNSNHDACNNDAYRSEIIKVICALTFLRPMESMLSIRDDFELPFDNDEVIHKLNHTTYITLKMKHHDAVRSLINSRDAIQSNIHFTQVIGHTDDKVRIRPPSRPEELNILCDTLVETTRLTLPHVHDTSTIFH